MQPLNLETAAETSAQHFQRGTPPLAYTQTARFYRAYAVALGLTHDCPECEGRGRIIDGYGSGDCSPDWRRCDVCGGSGKRVQG